MTWTSSLAGTAWTPAARGRDTQPSLRATPPPAAMVFGGLCEHPQVQAAQPRRISDRRFALDGGLAASDRSTHYGGGPRGHTNYPMWVPSGASG